MAITLHMWLLIFLGVLILGIVIDGIRRWRQHQRNPYRLSLGAVNINTEDDPFRHVFPSGGARPVDPVKLESTPELLTPADEQSSQEPEIVDTPKPVQKDSFFSRSAKPKEASVEKVAKPKQATQQKLDLTESVPVLMDPIFPDENDEVFDSHSDAHHETEELNNTQLLFEKENKKQFTPKEAKTSKEPEIEEAIVLNVFSKDAQGFQGEVLLDVLLGSGLRYGDMSIFHRHQSPTGEGKVLFSVANAMKPGTFKIEAMNKFSTKGLSFFFGLPSPNNPIEAFDLMLETAQYLSKRLNGELKDDKRSVLTAQTIEHYRARIRDFERRYLAQ